MKTRKYMLVSAFMCVALSASHQALGVEKDSNRKQSVTELHRDLVQKPKINAENYRKTLALGGETGGGGNSLKNRLIEEYGVNIQALPAWIEVIEPILKNWNSRLPSMQNFISSALRDTHFYLVPANIKHVGSDVTGLPFISNQSAVQCDGEVFVDAELFNKMYSSTGSRWGQASLILHELALNKLMGRLENCGDVGPAEHALTRSFAEIFFQFSSKPESEIQEKLTKTGWGEADFTLYMSSRKIENDQTWAMDVTQFRKAIAEAIAPFCSDPRFPKNIYLDDNQVTSASEVVQSMQRSIVKILYQLQLLDGETLEKLDINPGELSQVQLIGNFYQSDINDRYRKLARSVLLARNTQELANSSWHNQKLENKFYTDYSLPYYNIENDSYPFKKNTNYREPLKFWIGFCQNYRADMPIHFEKNQMLDVDLWSVPTEIKHKVEAPCYSKECASKMKSLN